MHNLAVIAACGCLAFAACGSSDVQYRTSAFTGQWNGQGVGEAFPLTVPESVAPSAGVTVTNWRMDVASTELNRVQLSPLPFTGMFVPVEMQVAGDSSLVGVPSTSTPVTVTCPSDVPATCGNYVLTLEGGSGTLSGGVLAVSFHGHYTQCCSTERFVYGFMGVRK
jgi:hypothetical protein